MAGQTDPDLFRASFFYLRHQQQWVEQFRMNKIANETPLSPNTKHDKNKSGWQILVHTAFLKYKENRQARDCKCKP